MTILEVRCEAGSLTLIGERNLSGVWSFRLDRDETGTFEALSDEDRESLSHIDARGSSKSVSSLIAALGLLDRYSWFRLIPFEVHPEFQDAILLAVRKRGTAENEVNWKDSLRGYQPASAIESNANPS